MNPELKEDSIYFVYEKGRKDIAKYEKGKFLFFGWEVPESINKFEKWEEVSITIKN